MKRLEEGKLGLHSVNGVIVVEERRGVFIEASHRIATIDKCFFTCKTLSCLASIPYHAGSNIEWTLSHAFALIYVHSKVTVSFFAAFTALLPVPFRPSVHRFHPLPNLYPSLLVVTLTATYSINVSVIPILVSRSTSLLGPGSILEIQIRSAT